MAAAAIAWAILVVYGSLTPFAYQSLEWTRAASILRWIVENPPQEPPRGDWVTNFLLLAPLGFCGLGSLLVDRDTMFRRGWGIGLMLAGGLVLSISVETAQLWFPPRHPAKADVIAQTLGNVVGMGLWILAGQSLTDWTRRHVRGPRAGRAVWLLAVYVAGLFIYSLLPLDLTIRRGDLWDKYKSGQVALVPFARWTWDVQSIYGAARDVAVFLPVGMLAALWPIRDERADQRIILRWLAGVALVGSIEFLQLFVRSRHSDVTDLILGAIGVSGGLAGALSWNASSSSRPLAAGLKAACLIGFVLLLAAVYLEPFHFEADHGRALARLAAMVRVPLEALRQGELLEMISNVARKLMLFGILGWLTSETARGFSMWNTAARLPVACGLAGGLFTAATIEIVQAWFPPHVPDVTDVFWGALGGSLGSYVGMFLDQKAQCR